MKKELKIKVGENDIKKSDIARVNVLLKQLNPEAGKLSYETVKEVMSRGIVLTLRDASKKHKLIGMATLLPVRKLFVYCGTIEDVVIDESYRGKGLGKGIAKNLIKRSKVMGMKFVDLTSNPDRVVANNLYQSVGFVKRETNVYRLNHPE